MCPPVGRSSDVVVVGAGIVGASVAFELAHRGVGVTVIDRGSIVSGTTAAGEGNILVSDKDPGPELDLALCSRQRWLDYGDLLDDVELEEKGGLIACLTDDAMTASRIRAERQGRVGVVSEHLDVDRALDVEPALTPELFGALLYPQDLQVQPMLAAARLLAAARSHGARVLTGEEVVGIDTGAGGRIRGVRTTRLTVSCSSVVNAAGTWAGELAALAGAPIPVAPRRGFILVTEPLGPMIRHKVYGADYVANVASGASGIETSPVIEGTRAGPVLIGSSRERVGFDRTVSFEVLARLAANAIALVPTLAHVRVQRSYHGFRPYCPDHLPIIGADPRVPGLLHACGHEGAGVGLAPGTALALAAIVTGATAPVDLCAFAPTRFEGIAA